jgi:hypothetical protein
MAFDEKGLENYIDVAQRIADFRERYPDGSLQPVDHAAPFEVRKIDGTTKGGQDFTATFIIYTAAAYRTPHDQRPGIGCAWEVFPGRTPYTLGSELMNAETSAQGRAIVAALASDSKRGVASREEIRNRRAEQEADGEDEVPRNRDGSISKRRATAAQKEAAGLMSPEQEKAHNALREGADGRLTKADAAKRQACSPGNPCRQADCPHCTPDADLWTLEPPPDNDLRQGPPLRKPQAARPLPEQIATYFTTLGINDRDVRLGYTMRIAGTGRLSSSKELTASQARKVRDVLAQCGPDIAALHEYLDSNQEVTSGA